MLLNLLIKNVALIETAEINFDDGLNILSGETGAGKSMIIDSINFIMGQRPSKDFIRNEEGQAEVQLAICVNNLENSSAIKQLGIPIDEDNLLIIQRTVNESGKGTLRINGKISNLGMVKEISSYLLDLHGQHEHQSLLDGAKHIELLDKFCGEQLIDLKQELNDNIKIYKGITKKLNDIIGDEKEKQNRIDLYNYQINEIENASLENDEEETLQNRRKVLLSSEKIIINSSKSLELLHTSNDERSSALDNISNACKMIEDISLIDTEIAEISESLYQIQIRLDETTRDLRAYLGGIEIDPNEIEEIEERLNLIYNLKRKYGNNINEILSFYKKTKDALDLILNSEEEVLKLKKEKDIMLKSINFICSKISSLRDSFAEIIESKMETTLKDLGMKDVKFKIQIEKKLEFNQNGYDKVEFLISPNLGESLKPLVKIASGGEMSRVMLALKTVLADVDTIETFIFDEIDSGVSGRTAQQVAEKLSRVANNHQIICITHLPQIASMADNHFLIEKKSENNKTITEVFKLGLKDSIIELARLLGGAKITDATLNAAEEMKQMALKFKNPKV